MNSKLTIGGLAALFIAGAASTQPAYASIEESVITRHVEVTFRRAELANEAGARQLLERLDRAARRACRNDGPALNAGRNSRACRDAARDEAVRKVNAPMLTAVNGGPAPIQLATK